MGRRMEITTRYSQRGIIIIVFLLFFLSPTLGYTLDRRDTLVYRQKRDTSVLVKAQIVDIDSTKSLMFYKTRPFGFVGYVPRNIADFCRVTTRKKNLPTVGILAGSTALLIVFDQKIIDASQQFGRFIHLDAERKFTTAIAFNAGSFRVPVLDIPQNLNSGFYFLGEGWPSIIIASSYYGYGLIKKDYRALQTSSELTEMFLTLAITTQFIKRVTGRESPFVASTPGGKWSPFTNPSKYQKHVPYYDAFPSGHLATAMATVTIISGNYPECRYVKPIGYSLMGILGYAMMNNGVHWASDYPLAIAIGYAYGKIALSHGQQVINKKHSKSFVKTSFTPILIGENGFGMSYRVRF